MGDNAKQAILVDLTDAGARINGELSTIVEVHKCEQCQAQFNSIVELRSHTFQTHESGNIENFIDELVVEVNLEEGEDESSVHIKEEPIAPQLAQTEFLVSEELVTDEEDDVNDDEILWPCAEFT